MTRRKCKATTKRGTPCLAAPIGETDLCIAHSDKETRAKAGFGGAKNGAKGGEAKRVPKLTELLRQRVEDRADEILDKLFKMLNAERAVVVGTGPKAHVEIVSDDELALKAIREIYDRAEGRARQVAEISGPDGGPIPTEQLVPTAEEWQRRFAEGMREAGMIPEPDVAQVAQSNGHR